VFRKVPEYDMDEHWNDRVALERAHSGICSNL
jgi:hypothetical protein